MRTTPARLALELFDQRLPELQNAARVLSANALREGWVRSLRKSLGLSMRAFAHRMNLKATASIKDLERNEKAGTITLQTLRRAAEAIDADFVYAIVPRNSLRKTIGARAEEIARERIAAVAKSMALESQGLTQAQIDRQIDELARELERKPEALWR